MSNKEYDILIIEDNLTDLELMVRTLKRNHLANNLITFEDGEQALEYLLKSGNHFNRKSNVTPKVIFLDLKLPKVNGLEVLAQLKANDKTKKIPVVIVTSSNQDPDIKAAYELGANSFVVKPVDYDEFQEKMNTLGLYWLMVNESDI